MLHLNRIMSFVKKNGNMHHIFNITKKIASMIVILGLSLLGEDQVWSLYVFLRSMKKSLTNVRVQGKQESRQF